MTGKRAQARGFRAKAAVGNRECGRPEGDVRAWARGSNVLKNTSGERIIMVPYWQGEEESRVESVRRTGSLSEARGGEIPMSTPGATLGRFQFHITPEEVVEEPTINRVIGRPARKGQAKGGGLGGEFKRGGGRTRLDKSNIPLQGLNKGETPRGDERNRRM